MDCFPKGGELMFSHLSETGRGSICANHVPPQSASQCPLGTGNFEGAVFLPLLFHRHSKCGVFEPLVYLMHSVLYWKPASAVPFDQLGFSGSRLPLLFLPILWSSRECVH